MSSPSYATQALSAYLDDAASGRPTPGGGSIAAMAGALGASMSCMVANFTTGKKRYLEVQDEIGQIITELQGRMARLLALVDEDVKAYAKMSAAYAMPKESEEEKAARSQAIVNACKEALQAPLDAAREAADVSKLAGRLADIGNQNLITDAGVSALMCLAAVESAALNVEINLSSVKDKTFCAEVRSDLKAALTAARSLRNQVWEKVIEAIAFDDQSSLT